MRRSTLRIVSSSLASKNTQPKIQQMAKISSKNTYLVIRIRNGKMHLTIFID